MGVQATHVLFDVRDLAKVEKSEHKGIENSEGMGSRTLANLACIFGESTIAAVMQAIFDGPVLAVSF